MVVLRKMTQHVSGAALPHLHLTFHHKIKIFRTLELLNITQNLLLDLSTINPVIFCYFLNSALSVAIAHDSTGHAHSEFLTSTFVIVI